MEALKKKFKSRRGASILLALLFMLLCVLVGASVVMAADSNAGKTQSNKEEQQKYLTLSSAMTLLCDELTSVQFTKTYTYTVDPVDASDNEVDPDSGDFDHYKHNYSLDPLEIKTRDGAALEKIDEALLTKVIPLGDNIDSIFKTAIEQNKTSYSPGDTEVVVPTWPTGLEFTPECHLKIKMGEADPVLVDVVMSETTGRITLTAYLTEQHDDEDEEEEDVNDVNYAMKAELVYDTAAPTVDLTTTGTKTFTATWKLNYIVKANG